MRNTDREMVLVQTTSEPRALIQIRTFNEGAQAPAGGIFKASWQIRPAVSTFGWYMGVKNRIFGGSNGYLFRSNIEASIDDEGNRNIVPESK